MDQASFRELLGSQTSASGSSRPVAGGSRIGGSFAGGRQRVGLSAGLSSSGTNGIPPAHKSSVDQFKPRVQSKGHSLKGKGKAEEQAQPKSTEPTHKRYGYADRASMRRAGIDEADLEAEEERRPRGLDLSKLDAARRALLTGSDAIDSEEVQPDDVPPKTEDEIERELAEAEKGLDANLGDTEAKKQASRKPEEVPPLKKQKRSRAEMLRDLQAKIAAATSGTQPPSNLNVTDPSEDRLSQSKPSKKKKEAEALPEQAKFKGFKVVERAPEKKKKSKPLPLVSDVNGIANMHAHSTTTDLGGKSVPITSGNNVGEAFDPDADIFAGAGDYDDGLSADEGSIEEGEEKEAVANEINETEAAGPIKYFDDQDEIIPKFQTYRSPTPPPRRRSGSPPARGTAGPDDDETVEKKPQRLEGFSTSQYTARDLLEADKALEREEKRKLRKLKGQEKKEEAARIAELEGKLTREQKEKDRLNREAQEYENYERKKQKRSHADS